jgi:alpha-glucosidase
MATFLMFYRTHSSTSVSPRAPWTYGEPYLSLVRRLMHLRHQLMPYFYTLAWDISQTGHPPVRPLFWADSRDRALWSVDDAFLLGDALLICPVVTEGARSRTVALPEGQWYDFWTDAPIDGGTTVQLAAPLETIPVLVKAGSIVPMEDGTALILHLYPPASGEGSGMIYSDAGDGDGASRIDRFRLIRQENGLELIWDPQGDYPFPYETVQIQLHGLVFQQAQIDGQEMTLDDQSLHCPPSFQHIHFC